MSYGGRPSQIHLDGMNEPRFRREGGTRDMVLPGKQKFIEGDILPRRPQGSGERPIPAKVMARRGCVSFRFLSRDEFVDMFLDDLELPDLPSGKLAEPKARTSPGPGYATTARPRTFRCV